MSTCLVAKQDLLNGPPLIKRIGILNPTGTGNLGDDATVAALIQNIKHRYPDAHIYAFTTNPDDTQRRHKIPTYPARCTDIPGKRDRSVTISVSNNKVRQNLEEKIKDKLKTIPFLYTFLKAIQRGLSFQLHSRQEVVFLIRAYRILKKLDLFLIAGSGQLSDHFGGTWNFPYTLLQWSTMARIAKTKLAFLSVGAGPLNSGLSRLFIKWALSLANYRSFRDQESKKLIENIGVRGDNPIFPDLAASLYVNSALSAIDQKISQPIVGINPFPHYHHRYWPVTDHAEYQRYINKLASFVLWLLQRNYRILFFPTQLHADPLVIHDIKDILKKNGTVNLEKYLIEQPLLTVEDLLSQLSIADIVVATRFHGILLSFLVNKPVVAISNHHKMTDLMRDMGQSDYVLDIGEFDVQSLIERFTLLESQSEIVRSRITQKISEYGYALEQQYELVLNLIESEQATRSSD